MNCPLKEGFKFLIGDIKIHPTTGVTLEYLKKSNAVCFTLFDEKVEKVLLVKQYRPASDENMLEIVAGLIDKDEDPRNASNRELLEETGYSFDDVCEVFEMPKALYLTPGYSTEKLYFYGGKLKSNDIVPKELNLDEGEDIETEWVDISKINDNIDDIKTVFGVMYFKNLV